MSHPFYLEDFGNGQKQLIEISEISGNITIDAGAAHVLITLDDGSLRFIVDGQHADLTVPISVLDFPI